MAQEVFRIPLENTPQRFEIELSGIAMLAVSRWNDEMSSWVLDLFDADTQVPKILSMPLVTGANLLEQFEYIGIPGQLLVYTDGNELAPPTIENLGGEANLYYVVDIE